MQSLSSFNHTSTTMPSSPVNLDRRRSDGVLRGCNICAGSQWSWSVHETVTLLLQMGWGYCQVLFSWQKFSLLPTISALQERNERVAVTDGCVTCTVLTARERHLNKSDEKRCKWFPFECLNSVCTDLADTSTKAHLILWMSQCEKGSQCKD